MMEIMLQHYSKLLFLISIILLCVTVYVSFIVGTIPISLKDILTQFTTGHVSNVDTIIDLRLPRIIIAFMCWCNAFGIWSIIASSFAKPFS